jgi:hypothetical protein
MNWWYFSLFLSLSLCGQLLGWAYLVVCASLDLLSDVILIHCVALLSCWCLLMVRVRHPVGNPKRKVWGAQQQVSLSCETKVYRTSRRKPNFRSLMLASFATLRTTAPEEYWCVVDVGASSPAATWNLHTTQPRTLPQLTMRLSISPICCKQRIEHIEW